MKTCKHKLCAAIALAGIALFAPSMQAALTYASNDLFLGFRQSGNTTKEYAINIGQASVFRDATSSFTLSLNVTSFAADMQSAFGLNWRTAGDVYWGVIGTTQNTAAGSDPIRLLYASLPTASTAPAASSSQSGPANNIITFKNAWQTAGVEGSVANSAIMDPGNANSWTNSVGNAAGPFGTGALTPLEALIGTQLDLFRMPQTTTLQPVTNEGTFSLNTTSNLITFAPPVPEPSTTALAGVVLLVWIGRLRSRRGSRVVTH